MKKYLMFALATLVASVMVSGVALAKEHKGDKGTPVTVSGTLKVDGEAITLTTDDGVVYTVKSHGDKDLAAKNGQKVELKGMVSDKDGAKVLYVHGAGKHGGKKHAEGGEAVPAPAPAQ